MNKKWKLKNYNKMMNRVTRKDEIDNVMDNGSTNIRNSVIATKEMPSTYRIVYMALETLCFGDKDKCFPSNSTLAYIVGKSVRTVQRAIKYLKEHDFIRVESRVGTTNLFTILKKVIFEKKGKEKFYKKSNKKSQDKKEININPSGFNNFPPREDLLDPEYMEALEEKLRFK